MMPDLVSTQDHDLLIQLHTKMDTMLLALDTIRQLENSTTRHSEKIKAIDIASKSDIGEIREEIKALKARDMLQSLALIIGTIIASTIAWFKH
jgi:hypothetical protein